MAIALPPIHPILVNFTAALVPVSLLADFLGRLLKKESLQSAGWWTMLFAALISPFTALAGWLWLRSMGGSDHPEMAIHQWLGTTLVVALVPMAIWRGWMLRRGQAAHPAYLLALALAVAGLVVQGHLGGTMSFGTGQTDAAEHGEEPGSHEPS